MSKLIQKIDDEIEKYSPIKNQSEDVRYYPVWSADQMYAVLRAFKAFITDCESDLDEESFSEYEQNALAVWEDE